MEKLLVGETVAVNDEFLGIVHGFQYLGNRITGVWVRPIVMKRNDGKENPHAAYHPDNVRARRVE